MLPALWLSRGQKRWLRDGAAPSSSALEACTHFTDTASVTEGSKLLCDTPGYRKDPQPCNCSHGKRGTWPGGCYRGYTISPLLLMPLVALPISYHGQGWDRVLSALPWATPGPRALEQSLQVLPPLCPKSIINNRIRPFPISLFRLQGTSPGYPSPWMGRGEAMGIHGQRGRMLE